MSSFEACLKLKDPSNATIAMDCPPGGMAEIEFTLTTTGVFTIIASDDIGDNTGSYGLSLEIVNDPSFAQPVGCGLDTTVSLIHFAEMEAFSIPVASGDILRLQARGSTAAFEATLQLYDPSGNLVASAGPGAGGLTAIDNFIAASSGDFTLVLSDDVGDNTSAVGVSLQKLNRPACTQPVGCGLDTTVSLIHFAEMEAFSFFSTAGSEIDITAEASTSSFEEMIQIFDTDGNLLFSDTANSGFASIENFVIPASEDYIFLVSDDFGDNISSLQVILSGQCSETKLCTDDLVLNLNPIPSNIYKAAETIQSNGTLATGTDVTFKAGISFTLKEGFTIDLGAVFTGLIEACNVP